MKNGVNEPRPIETWYNGLRFRSRLEARWAVYFDALGIKYRYECEGYWLTKANGWRVKYLPDFYLPEVKRWVEVKGVMDMESAEKIALFKAQVGELEVLRNIYDYTEDEIMQMSIAERVAINMAKTARFEWGDCQSASEIRAEAVAICKTWEGVDSGID